VAKQTRHILNIEYEYAQLCISSLALQAAINREAGDSASGRQESCSQGASTEEKKHLRGTVTAARTILRTVLDDLLPHGSLTYIPVRSYSRLLGAALILLKVSQSHMSLSFVGSFFLFLMLNRGISVAPPVSARSTYPCPFI
jgi:hypothetical protein